MKASEFKPNQYYQVVSQYTSANAETKPSIIFYGQWQAVKIPSERNKLFYVMGVKYPTFEIIMYPLHRILPYKVELPGQPQIVVPKGSNSAWEFQAWIQWWKYRYGEFKKRYALSEGYTCHKQKFTELIKIPLDN
jgi:hypothetical protein